MTPSDLHSFAARHQLSADALDELAGLLETPWDRYVDLGALGEGGMGEVRRVHDRRLGRVVAMKVLHRELQGDPVLAGRFLQEAQALAQLSHPGIVPVYDAGETRDGRFWFTMPLVRGRTLRQVVDEAWQGQTPLAQPWTLRQLLEAFVKVCDAVGFAHARGVVHRDLKPSNVMLGPWGDVLVMDWGLAKVLDEEETLPLRTSRSVGDANTEVGFVAGTPAYMAPEQARGEIDRIGARTDVYSLGAILFEVLSGRAPYQGDAAEILQQVISGRTPSLAGAEHTLIGLTLDLDEPPRPVAGPTLPPALVQVTTRAMAPDPEDRFADATELGEAVSAWLAGARRREDGLAALHRAEQHAPAIADLRQRAERLDRQAQELLARIPPWGAEEVKAPGWALEDAAHDALVQAELRDVTVEQALQGALSFDPRLAEAHAALATRRRAALEQAEQRRDRRAIAQAEAELRTHLSALPPGHPDRQRHATWLRGAGRLTLLTDPPGAEVLLYRFAARRRRLVPRLVGQLGPTPLVEVELARGSWLLALRRPGHAEVAYPVVIDRLEHWDGVPPGGREPLPIALPAAGDLGPGESYVPPGWFRAGDDDRRLWCDGFFVQQLPVRRVAWRTFLGDVAVRDPELANALDVGLAARDPDPDDWPAAHVDRAAALAYAAWVADRLEQPWRLPSEWEWEKAARGVDGRRYPWGDRYDPAWARNRHSQPGPPGAARVGACPVDCSPYGVRDLAGGVAEWCLEAGDDPPPAPGSVIVPRLSDGATHVVRGGSWSDAGPAASATSRRRLLAGAREGWVGLRLVRSVAAARRAPPT